MLRHIIQITLVVVAMLTPSSNAGPIAYGICQAACATGCAVCGGGTGGICCTMLLCLSDELCCCIDGPHSLNIKQARKTRDLWAGLVVR